MMMSLERFLPKSHDLSELYMYMVLVEARKPILFVCKDRFENVYICSCHCATGEKTEWVIQNTTYQKVIDLLTNKITIREIFTSGYNKVYIATRYSSRGDTIVRLCNLQFVDDRILPTDGYYMDAEVDEFEEELQILEAADRHSREYDSVRFQDNIFAIMRSIPIQITIPAEGKKVLAAGSYTFYSDELVSVMVS